MSGEPALFQCATIVGMGMMGGSLGLALRAHGLARHVVGVDLNAQTLARAQERGAIDAGTTDMLAAAHDADALFFATPVGLIPDLLAAAAPHMRSDALVTDIGSTKATIVAAGERLLGARFIGGHPMAGSERSGIEAAQEGLFAGAAWAIVRSQPFDAESDEHAQRLGALARALGSRPIFLDAAQHDRIVALVSHLPHILSFAYAGTVAASAEAAIAPAMAAGSYRDMMRVSRADRDLWNDIFRDNRVALLDALDAYERQFSLLKRSLLDS